MPGETKSEWTRGDDGAPGKTWNPGRERDGRTWDEFPEAPA